MRDFIKVKSFTHGWLTININQIRYIGVNENNDITHISFKVGDEWLETGLSYIELEALIAEAQATNPKPKP